MLNFLIVLYFLPGHFLWFSLVRQVENVVHPLHLFDFATVFELLHELQEYFLVEEDTCAPTS